MNIYKVTAIIKNAAGVSVRVDTLSSDSEDCVVEKNYLISSESLGTLGINEGCEIGDAELAALSEEAEYCRALARSLKILSYSSHSKAALVRKLCTYDFSREIAVRAANGIEASGELNEMKQASHLCDYFLAHKYWGKKRVAAELMSRGYGREVVMNVLNETPEERFIENLEKLVERRPVPEEKGERDKYLSALSRMGYSMSDIFKVIKK